MASTGSPWTRRSGARPPRLGARALVVLLSLHSLAGPAAAQTPPSEPTGATLQGWEERARLTILDRGGSINGRTSDQGILQRFNARMDSEYPLDLISSSPSLSEDYEWYRRGDGARAWAGSIDHLSLVSRAQVAAAVLLGKTWAIDVWFDNEESLEADRSLVRLRVRHTLFSSDVQAFVAGTVKARKPETDLELGAIWSAGPGTVTVGLAALDVFNDFIYGDLGVSAGIADTVLDYTSHPYTARVALQMPVGDEWRVEAYALAMTPADIAAQSQTQTDVGFVQQERYAYAGALVEWSPGRRMAIGAFATWVRARLGRTPLPASPPADEFDLTEKTASVGVYALRRFLPRLAGEAWLAWRRRDHDRIGNGANPTSSLYGDRAWEGRLDLTYRNRIGLRATLGLDFVAPAVEGLDRVPGSVQEADHSRLRLDLGWRIGQRASLLLGGNFDLDIHRRGCSGVFDGAHGRVVLYW